MGEYHQVILLIVGLLVLFVLIFLFIKFQRIIFLILFLIGIFFFFRELKNSGLIDEFIDTGKSFKDYISTPVEN